MESGEPGRVLYPIEVLALVLNLVFAVGCFLNLGEVRRNLLGVSVDRELAMGLFFLLLTPATLLVVRLLNPGRSRLARFLRLCYLQILYAVYFTECIWLSQVMFDGAFLDPFFARLDQRLFGFQPAVEFSRAFRHLRPVNELFFFGYFFYYALVTSGVWVLFARRRLRDAEHVLFVISAAFFVMYVWFALFPVQGPKYFLPELRAVWYSEFRGYLFTNLMRGIFDRTNLAGAAFPSSHVAIGVVSLLLNWKHNRALVPLYLPMTLLLMGSTVYLYAHYFVDVPAGVVTGIGLYLVVPRLEAPARRAARSLDRLLARRLRFPTLAADALMSGKPGA